ncbi:MAG: hypothetical protein HC856_00700 [Pseudanabaena sp. RU_4_16]|nr:hypothetical protein [Pseudanabaena sp. RU_4_16]
MPRFQSWLFNSIDRSLPVQLGRRVRLACQQLVDRIGKPRLALLPAAWEQISKHVARVVLYPVYLIAIAAKRSYPQLSPDPKSAPTKPPLLLRPFQQLVVWAEDTELYTVGREPDNESNQPNLTVRTAEAENTPDSISSQTNVSPQVVQPQPGQETLGQNEQPLDRIRQLIKAAIDYFFGKKTTLSPSEATEDKISPAQIQEMLPSNLEGAAATPNSISLQPHAIPPIQQQHSGQLGARAYQLVSMQYEQQLERIRQLIKAAIAYFFGKKPNVTPLDTVVEVRSQPWLTMADLFDDDSGHWPAIAQDKTGRREVSPWESPQFDGINTAQSKSLKAVPNTALARNPNRNLTQNKYAGITSTASSDPLAGAIARESEHTTSEIVPDLSCWLDDSFDIEIEERSRPLQAWIETQATFLGYVYSPIMEFIHCLDRLMAKFEQWLVQLWQKIWNKLRGDV